MDFSKLKEIIEQNETFLLTCHVNPDADALGSEIAFAALLQKLGKSVGIVNHSETPDFLKFLDYQNLIEKYEPEKHDKLIAEVDVLVAIDFNQSDRVVSMEESFVNSKALKICIDHHQEPHDFVDFFFNGTEFTATGEIIFDFIKETKIIELDEMIALNLYSAIMTDTGSFRFERTTAKTHLIAAELLKFNLSPIEIYDKLYNQNDLSKIALLGATLETIATAHNGKVAYMTITRKMLADAKADESEVDGFVNYCMSVKGVRIGLLFLEVKKGIKISYRSKGEIPVNKLAAEFEGGGHTNAAGSRIYGGTLKEYLPKIVAASEKYID